jgi:hypothetical protein
MHLIKKIILGATFSVCPFFHSVGLAEDKFIINYNIINDHTLIKDIAESELKNIISKDGSHIPFILLNINIGEQYDTSSYTDAQNEQCKININYHDKTPLLMNNFNDDFQFILAHEVGHCILGKKIFYKNDFNWVIKDEQLKLLNQQIQIQTDLSINTLECKKCAFKIAPPIAVYHEIYADIYGISWLIENKKNFQPILILSKKRIDNFNKHPINNFYGSGFSMPTLLEYMGNNSKLKNFETVEIIAQKGFASYLKFMNENYFSKQVDRSVHNE